MRILWTNHALDQPAGTEIFTRDMVGALCARGHAVEVLTSRPGAMAAELRLAGVPVHEDPRVLEGKFDVIHGQHFIETVLALAALPGTPALFFCHADPGLEWMEHPPVHPRIFRWLASCKNLAGHLAGLLDMDGARFGWVPNAIDCARFTRVRPPASPPRSALFYHNTQTQDSPDWHAAAAACATLGIALDAAGAGFGRRIVPEACLPDYDIVFAGGRSAMEAVASGCATVIVGPGRCAGLAGPDDYPALRDSNFTRGARVVDMAEEPLAAELRGSSPAAVQALCAMVRRDHSLDSAATRLEQEYAGVLAHAGAAGPPDAAEESLALAVDLRVAWRQMAGADARVRAAARAGTRLEEKLEHTSNRLAEANQRLKAVETVLQRGWFRRSIWRAVQRRWHNPPAGD